MTGRLLSSIFIGDFNLNLPNPGGFFSGGLLSGVGVALQIALGLTLAVWIFLTLLAALNIIRSEGNAEMLKENVSKIKYIWIAASSLGIFFVIISIVGSIVGFGSPLDWGNTLAQCGGYSGPFYFAQVDQETDFYTSRLNIPVDKGLKAYCCNFNLGEDKVTDTASPFYVYKDPLLLFEQVSGSNLEHFGIGYPIGQAWYLPYSAAPIAADGSVSYNGSATGITGCVQIFK